jgi:hypothetical protein
VLAMILSVSAFLCISGCPGPGTSRWAEEARVASPDGRFDAIMAIETVPGVLGGGVYWNVFIVPKGDACPNDEKKSLFYASSLRGEKLVWKQNHLLEVHYDFAEIGTFHNVWGTDELKGRGWRPGDYLVEVRLAPTSPDFSFLTPDGGVKLQ